MKKLLLGLLFMNAAIYAHGNKQNSSILCNSHEEIVLYCSNKNHINKKSGNSFEELTICQKAPGKFSGTMSYVNGEERSDVILTNVEKYKPTNDDWSYGSHTITDGYTALDTRGFDTPVNILVTDDSFYLESYLNLGTGIVESTFVHCEKSFW